MDHGYWCAWDYWSTKGKYLSAKGTAALFQDHHVDTATDPVALLSKCKMMHRTGSYWICAACLVNQWCFVEHLHEWTILKVQVCQISSGRRIRFTCFQLLVGSEGWKILQREIGKPSCQGALCNGFGDHSSSKIIAPLQHHRGCSLDWPFHGCQSF